MEIAIQREFPLWNVCTGNKKFSLLSDRLKFSRMRTAEHLAYTCLSEHHRRNTLILYAKCLHFYKDPEKDLHSHTPALPLQNEQASGEEIHNLKQ